MTNRSHQSIKHIKKHILSYWHFGFCLFFLQCKCSPKSRFWGRSGVAEYVSFVTYVQALTHQIWAPEPTFLCVGCVAGLENRPRAQPKPIKQSSRSSWSTGILGVPLIADPAIKPPKIHHQDRRQRVTPSLDHACTTGQNPIQSIPGVLKHRNSAELNARANITG